MDASGRYSLGTMAQTTPANVSDVLNLLKATAR